MLKRTFYLYILFSIIVTHLVSAQYNQGDWSNRDRWMHVTDLFNLADLGADDHVADLGCHEGYLSMHLSEVVGKMGKVYAIDINEERLFKLQKLIKRKKIQNIETIHGQSDDPKLPLGQLDIVFVIDTYHEISAYKTMLSHLKNSLKPGGRIVILEKIKDHMKGKMREQQVAAHTLASKYVKTELEIAGFNILRTVEHFGYWEQDLNKVMWVIVAQKP